MIKQQTSLEEVAGEEEVADEEEVACEEEVASEEEDTDDEQSVFDNEILSKLDISNSKVIKMKNKQYVYIREDSLGGLLYDPKEFTQYKDNNDFKIKNYGRLEIKEGKYYFKENI